MPAAAFSQSAIYIANLVPEESSTEFSIGHLVNTDKEVDKIMEQVQRAGAIIIKPAQKTFWGRLCWIFQGHRLSPLENCSQPGIGS